MESAMIKPRRSWLAALLSLLGSGPLGQVYTGRFRRSVVLWTLGALLQLILTFAYIALPLGRFGLALFCLCVLALPIYMAVDAFLLAKRNRDAPLKRYQRWWIYLLVFVAFCIANNTVALGVRTFLAEAFVVPSRSMSPTIQPGDQIMVDKLWCSPKSLQRNDIVVFRSEGPDSEPFVMRVVGLPGDEIKIRDEQVFLNGTKWDDQHAVFDRDLPSHAEFANYGPIKIPSDSFFVLGDNRRLSKDSRSLGPIPLSDLLGKARIIYWAWERRFPDPADTSRYERGQIRWDRMGTRLD